MKNLPVVFFIPMLGIKIMILVFSNKILVIKFFTLATVATLQHYLRISVLRVATR